MSHWQTTIGSPNTAAKYRRPNRGTRRYKIDLITSKIWTLGKQLIENFTHGYCVASTDRCHVQNRYPISVFIFLHRCRCGNCSLERLQNAGERLKLLPSNREMRRISIKWWRFPGSRDNSTMRDNASRFQCRCLNYWSLRSAAAKYETIDGRKYSQTGSEQT